MNIFIKNKFVFFCLPREKKKDTCRIMWKLSQQVILSPKPVKVNEKSEFGHVQQDQKLLGCVPKAPNEGETLQKNSTPFYMHS